MEEIWKPIPGLEERYEISNLGRVKSKCWLGNPGKEGILKGWINGRGYKSVRLDRSRSVHSIVAECFLGPRPDNLVIDHINGNKLDNRSINLRYIPNELNVQLGVCKKVKITRNDEIYLLSSCKEACQIIGCTPGHLSKQAKLGIKVKGWTVGYE